MKADIFKELRKSMKQALAHAKGKKVLRTKRVVIPTGKISRVLALGVLLSMLGVHADEFSATVKDTSSDNEKEIKTANAPVPAAAPDAPATQKATETPHFWQRDSRGGFENGGRDYCSPVAVSNSFCYLAHHGFPALLSDGDGDQPQIDLINLLASSDYFGTDPDIGTAPGAVLRGVQKYIREQGYHCERLEYEGWRKIGRNQQNLIKAAQPNLDWIKKGIHDPHGSVWLNLGWYTKVGDGGWKRTGGHWVTLVGYDEADPNVLLIHNPATRGNGDKPDDPTKDIIHLKLVSEGTLDTGKGSTQNAAGMYQVSGPGLPIAHGVDAAFLDTAVVLVVGA